jgi:hypothetical protein
MYYFILANYSIKSSSAKLFIFFEAAILTTLEADLPLCRPLGEITILNCYPGTKVTFLSGATATYRRWQT